MGPLHHSDVFCGDTICVMWYVIVYDRWDHLTTPTCFVVSAIALVILAMVSRYLIR